MKDSKKHVIILIIILSVLLIGVTFAYFKAQGGEGGSSNVNVTTYTVDQFTFSVGQDLSISASQRTFGENMDSLSNSTFAKAVLKANNKTNAVTDQYSLYIRISENTFVYTNNFEPELLLKITDNDGNEITSVDGLSYKSVEDGKGNKLSGFDVTKRRGVFTLFKNREITASSTKEEQWNITLTFVNYDRDQSENALAVFNAKAMIQKNPEQVLLSDYVKSQYTGIQGDNGVYYHDNTLENGLNDGSYIYAGPSYEPDNYLCQFDGELVYNANREIGKSKAGDCSKVFLYTIRGVDQMNIYMDSSILTGTNSKAVRWDSSSKTCVTEDNNVVYYKDDKPVNEQMCSGIAYGSEYDGYYHESSFPFLGAGIETKGVTNYICLGSSEGACPDDKLFRIIGLFDDKIKVIKATTMSEMAWDSNGSNTWSTSSLNKYLNGEYLSSLGTLADKIVETTWKVGGNTHYNIAKQPAKIGYQNEILSPVPGSTSNGEIEYKAKIGLMYVSDYRFGASSNSWGVSDLEHYSDFVVFLNWLDLGYEWLITRDSSSSTESFLGKSSISSWDVKNKLAFRPVFYLDSKVIYKSGSGESAADPIMIY